MTTRALSRITHRRARRIAAELAEARRELLEANDENERLRRLVRAMKVAGDLMMRTQDTVPWLEVQEDHLGTFLELSR